MAVTLEMTLNSLRGHVTLTDMSPIDRQCTTVYTHTLLSVLLYIALFQRYFRSSAEKIAFFTPSLFHSKI